MSDSGSDNESNRSSISARRPTDPDQKSGSNSPDSPKSRQVNQSKSPIRSRSVSKSRSRSRSKSKSKSRSRSRSRSKSKSTSRSPSIAKSRSRSTSRERFRNRSRSPVGPGQGPSPPVLQGLGLDQKASLDPGPDPSPRALQDQRADPDLEADQSPSSDPNRVQDPNRRADLDPSSDQDLGQDRSQRASLDQRADLDRSREAGLNPRPGPTAGKGESRSNTPNLEIDEHVSPRSEKRDSSVEKPVKKKGGLIDSESEDEFGDTADGGGQGGGGEEQDVSAAAIFGDADDISDDSDDERQKAESDKEAKRSRSRSRSRTNLQEIEKEHDPEPIPETRIDVEVPKIGCDLGRDLNFVKLPNFLSVETRPFDPETYEDEIDEEETLDEEGRARLKLKVENTIRWRDVLDNDGNTQKESNARFVRWSDGSYSLHLGSEIFDVYRQPLQGDHNHLFIRQGTGLQGQAVFRTKLSFRPHSTESFTHRKMTLSLADRSQKTSGIKILSQVGVDPDNDRAERLKKEEEKLRQTARPKTARKKIDSVARGHAARDSFREEDGSDDEGAISISAIKNKYKGAAAAAAASKANIYSSDEDESDVETRKGRKSDKARAALKDSDEESGSD
ncbi:hypothetical protein D910_06095 [Dendroctonus ponderosae]|uniref:RNA polymerase-associated protein LEO1 n=1 Tax=Dendroctonus ponderosae TaxID=77166 RepID=U4U8N1_DENPD|nr:hypothetical protein D910_06095 [Dendroctonus ponderosae]